MMDPRRAPRADCLEEVKDQDAVLMMALSAERRADSPRPTFPNTTTNVAAIVSNNNSNAGFCKPNPQQQSESNNKLLSQNNNKNNKEKRNNKKQQQQQQVLVWKLNIASATIITLKNDFSVQTLAKHAQRFRNATFFLDAPALVLQRVSFRSIDMAALSRGAIEIFNVPNAGGTSVYSEMLSFEVLKRCFEVELRHTEMQLQYFPIGSKKTDYSCIAGNIPLGVSVVRIYPYEKRAMEFAQMKRTQNLANNSTCLTTTTIATTKNGISMTKKSKKKANTISENETAGVTKEYVRKLLEKKLDGIQYSTRNVSKNCKFSKQILHVWVPTTKIARISVGQLRKIDRKLKGNTIVIISIAKGECDPIFFDKVKQK